MNNKFLLLGMVIAFLLSFPVISITAPAGLGTSDSVSAGKTNDLHDHASRTDAESGEGDRDIPE